MQLLWTWSKANREREKESLTNSTHFAFSSHPAYGVLGVVVIFGNYLWTWNSDTSVRAEVVHDVWLVWMPMLQVCMHRCILNVQTLSNEKPAKQKIVSIRIFHVSIKFRFRPHLPITANGYAHRMPHRPSSKRFDSGPQIFRKSFEFQPNGNATHPTIMLIAANNWEKMTKYVTKINR